MTGQSRSGKSTQHFYQGDRWISETGWRTVRALDAQGQTMAVQIDAVHMLQSDEEGSVLGEQAAEFSRADYSVYGYSRSGALAGPLGFNGHWLDPVLDAYLLGNGHRLYCPTLMRFKAPDGQSPFGKGGLNAYAYCSGDPVNRADPSGRVNIFKRSSQKTGLTAFMKRNNLPKKDVKPYLDVLKSTQRESPIEIYRLEGYQAKQFTFQSKDGGLSFFEKPDPVMYDDLEGHFFKRDNIYINLNVRNSSNVGGSLLIKGYTKVTLPEPTHVLINFPSDPRRTLLRNQVGAIRGHVNQGFS